MTVSATAERVATPDVGRLQSYAILVAMIAAIACGLLLRGFGGQGQVAAVTAFLSAITDIFLRLIRMIISPLVLFTLVAGVARMESAAAVGRAGLKAMSWFVAASLASLLLGMVLVDLLQPGAGAAFGPTSPGLQVPQTSPPPTLRDVLVHAVPVSIFDAMAQNQILQIVIFAVFAGTALTALPVKPNGLIALADEGAAVMLKITGYVMTTAPIAVFAALTSTIASQGAHILLVYAKFVGSFYLGLALLATGLVAAACLIAGRRALGLLPQLRQPLLIAFATASSEAAYPATLARLEGFGISSRIARFVLPLGYSFNMDGAMMYCTFAILFIAQLFRVHLDAGDRVAMLALLFLSTKGLAGVPRASLVVISATLGYFRIPEAGLLVILAVDHLLDMGRTAINVIGNSIASLVVSLWEGENPASLVPP